jgi:crossover junction endodeoxyribonuclease RuvC
MSNSSLTVLGVDPGLANLGLGVVREQRRSFTCVATSLITTSSRLDASARLHDIYTQVSGFLQAHQPQALALEGQYFHHQRAAAFKVGQAVGVVLLAAAEQHVPVFEYGPMQVKQTLVGTGRADKAQVLFMVRGMLELPAGALSHHVGDALALALTHLSFRRIHEATARLAPG